MGIYIFIAIIMAVVCIVGSVAIAAALLAMGNEYDRDLDRYFRHGERDRED